jgi:hypothetical protein
MPSPAAQSRSRHPLDQTLSRVAGRLAKAETRLNREMILKPQVSTATQKTAMPSELGKQASSQVSTAPQKTAPPVFCAPSENGLQASEDSHDQRSSERGDHSDSPSRAKHGGRVTIEEMARLQCASAGGRITIAQISAKESPVSGGTR